MKFSRKSFFQLLATAIALPGIAWKQIGSGQVIPRDPVALEPWLREWMRQPRIPVLESAEPAVARLIDAALRGEEVEFTYFGGSEPGRPRRISPGMVFHLEGSDVTCTSPDSAIAESRSGCFAWTGSGRTAKWGSDHVVLLRPPLAIRLHGTARGHGGHSPEPAVRLNGVREPAWHSHLALIGSSRQKHAQRIPQSKEAT